MKKTIILLLLFLIGCTNYNTIEPYSDECQELQNKFGQEHAKLDYSCTKDDECTYSMIGCSCKNINTDETKLEEIRNQEIDLGCIPQIECQPFNCKCINNKCKYKQIPRDEWSW